jgi:hypothetical protein
LANGNNIIAVFVDYDTWFWTKHNNRYSNSIDGLFERIKKSGMIAHVAIYGDFSKDFIKDERSRLEVKYPRMVRDSAAHKDENNTTKKKDLTDFYLLDDIYQTLFTNPTINQFILIAGDGHFHSALAHLKMYHQKEVGVYALKGTLSPLLKNTATWFVELEPEFDFDFCSVFRLLHNNEKKGLYSYFSSVTSYLSNNIENAANAVSYILNEGYAYQEHIQVPNFGERKVIRVNWSKVEEDGLWQRPR